MVRPLPSFKLLPFFGLLPLLLVVASMMPRPRPRQQPLVSATVNAVFENFPSTVPFGTAAYEIKNSEINRQGVTDASGNVYPQILAQNAYVPASAETINGLLDISY